MSNLGWKILTVLVVLVTFATLGVYPILANRYHLPAPGWLKAKELKRGLDLQGGVHLVLRVRTDDALKAETELEMDRVREELQKQGITVGNMTAIDPTHFRVEGVPSDKDAQFRNIAAEAQTNFDRSSGTNGSYTFTMRPNIEQ